MYVCYVCSLGPWPHFPNCNRVVVSTLSAIQVVRFCVCSLHKIPTPKDTKPFILSFGQRRGSSSEQDAVPPYSFDNPNARQTSMMAMESYRREQQMLQMQQLQQQQQQPQQQKPANGGAASSGVANNLAMVAASSAVTAVATTATASTSNPSNTGANPQGSENPEGAEGGDDEDNLSQAKGLPIQMMITPGVSQRLAG